MDIPGAFANNNKYNLKEWKIGCNLKRNKGEKWIFKGEIRIWSGKKWHCQHNKRKERCTTCGGAEICKHKRQRLTCKECGGSQICEHKRQRSTCKECSGSQICEHNIQRSRCKECGGSQICEHNRERSKCIQCGGSQICEHNRRKSRCKECGGAEICEHNRIRSTCKECSGASICEHNRIRSRCKDCGGGSICEHNRQRSACIQCEGSAICRICKSKMGNRKYDKLCVTCAIQEGYAVKRNYKTKELSMVEFITQHTDVDWVNDKAYDLGCSNKRPDMVCDLGNHILIIECDENKHKHGDYSCENKRIMELSQDFSENNIHRPIVVIRFNPDSYVDSNNQKIESCWKAGKDGILRIKNKENWDLRLNKLLETTHHYISNPPIKDVMFEYLFYDDYTKIT
uniref:Uncharacterized protein n=1 Tax=viral metagenome TaxID=1070528 RepID=A0A6C0AGU9_9ZZZZ